MKKSLMKILVLSLLLFALPLFAFGALADEGDHTHDGITFAAWEDASSLPAEAGNYYLTADVSLSETWTVPAGETNLDLNGHTVTLTAESGSVIMVSAGKTLSLYDCVGTGMITGGKGTESGGSTYGGGVYVNGTFYIFGGTISGNTASYGGGLYLSSKGTVSMNNGVVTNNTATSTFGGGVYTNGVFGISGAARVTGNTDGNGDANNVYLPSGKTVTIMGELSNDAQIGVNAFAVPSPGAPVVLTTNLGEQESDASKITSDKEDRVLLFSDAEQEAVLVSRYTVSFDANGGEGTMDPLFSVDGAEITLPSNAFIREGYGFVYWNTRPDGSGTDYREGDSLVPESSMTLYAIWSEHVHDGKAFLAWNRTDYLPYEPGNYYLTGDVSLSETWSVPYGETHLDLNGHTVTLTASSGSVIYISSGASLTLYDCEGSGVIKGGKGIKKSSVTYGGGVYVDSNAIFTLNGGKISGNTTTTSGSYGYGGGVYVSDNATFTMNGGTISGNTAVEGGGVCGSITMNGGTISGNTGRGVSVSGAFTMNGGTISGNTGGGGVYVYDSGSFTMSNGTISGNTGSGVYVSGTFTMSGGTISGNTGGGLSVSGSFEVSGDARIVDNTESGAQNNVWLPSGKTIAVIGELSEAASIGISTEFSPTIGNPVTITSGLSANGRDLGAFFADDDSQGIFLSDEGQEAVLKVACTVSFDANGGEGTMEPALSVDGAAISTVPAFSRSGYTFAYWFSVDGGSATVYTASSSFVPERTMTLYAAWEKDDLIDHVHDGILFEPWLANKALPSESGNYYLSGDVSLSATWNVPTGETHLDLNGHTITLIGESGSVINVLSDASLTLYDCEENGAIIDGKEGGVHVDGIFTMTGGEISENNGNGVGVYDGTFTMTGGEISENNGNGVGVYDGTFTMNGGEISGNTVGGVYVNNSSLFTIYSGKISGNTGSGVCVSGIFIMNGGTISENTMSLEGGGVYVWGGTFTMSGGEISRNTAEYDSDGVCVNYNGVFTMTGGEISENDGDGVFIYSGTFKMYDGKIYGNTGRGVYVENTFMMADGMINGNMAGGVTVAGGTFTMNGGTITGNTTDFGGGVYVDGIFNVSGDVRITDNTSNGEASNVWLYDGTVIITGTLSENASIGITRYINKPTVGTPVTVTSGLSANGGNLGAFFADDDSQGIFLSDDGQEAVLKVACTVSFDANGGEGAMDPLLSVDGAELTVPFNAFTREGYVFVHWNTKSDGTGTAYREGETFVPERTMTIYAIWSNHTHDGVSFAPWGSGTSLPSTSGNYYLTTDVSLSETWFVPTGETHLDLNGHSIALAADYGCVIYIPSGTSLTLYDCEDAGAITGGKDGGVYVSSAFTMNGGTISGNTGGGGVYVYDSGSFTMNNGTISGNTGSGVYVSGTFTMSGGTISGNTASDYGGGVCVDGTFTMNGGTINGNTASYGGGGVYVAYGTFTMNGGEISGNTSVLGGGVYVGENASFTITGGEISGNTASYGGGVYVASKGTFTMTGGTVSGNWATSSGGGVYACDDCAFIKVSGNARVVDNMKNGQTNNVYLYSLYSGVTVTIIGPLSENACIGITTGNTPFAGNPVTVTSGLAANGGNFDAFFSDNNAYDIFEMNGEAILAIPYTVSFDANGGEGTTELVKCASGTDVTLPECAFTRDGYYFLRWNTKADGTGTSYEAGESIVPSGNMTLYAIWQDIHVPVKHERVEPDHHHTGIDEYYVCSVCGKLFRDEACEHEITEEDTILSVIPHEFSEEWTYNESGHWHACSCGDRADEAAHVFDNDCDTTCNICGYVREITHAYQTAWSNDENSHWHKCAVCGEKTDMAPHSGGHADCMHLAECEVCGRQYGELGAHDLTKVEHKEADHHNAGNIEFYVCSVCGKYFSDAAGLTEIQPESVIIPMVAHSFSEEWTYNESGHWHACSCGNKADEAEHVFDNDCDTTCNICGYVREITHAYQTAWSNDESSHWHKCAVCGEKTDLAPHSGGHADCMHLAKCEVCGRQYGEHGAHDLTKVERKEADHHNAGNIDYYVCSICGKNFSDEACEHEITMEEIVIPVVAHSFSEEWTYDASGHWHACSCGDRADEAEHVFDDDYDTTCNACGYVRVIAKLPTITAQPASAAIVLNETVNFTVKASGGALSYQWQYSSDGGSTWTNSTMTGAKTATLPVKAISSRNGFLYRCVVTNEAGSTTSSSAKLTVITTPSITAQPKAASAALDETVNFTVTATGTGLSYQWQYSSDGGNTWTNSTMTGAKTATLPVKAISSRNGFLYRCVVTNAAGSVTSSSAKLTVITTPSITTQPKAASAALDETVNFTVTATGTGLSYQWQYSSDGGSTWTNSTMTGAKTATLPVKAISSRNGLLYRCKVTNSAGSVTSSSAKLTVITKPAITTQPKATSAVLDSTINFKVVASGTGLSYQWQYSSDNGSTWTNSTMTGAKTATLPVKAISSRNGLLYRCVVTNATGSVTSSSAKLTVITKPVITTQPKAASAALNETVNFTVKASGAGLSYQWQYSSDGGKTWTNSTMSGAKTATLPVKAISSRNGLLYRCVVTNAAGSVTSSSAKLTVK